MKKIEVRNSVGEYVKEITVEDGEKLLWAVGNEKDTGGDVEIKKTLEIIQSIADNADNTKITITLPDYVNVSKMNSKENRDNTMVEMWIYRDRLSKQLVLTPIEPIWNVQFKAYGSEVRMMPDDVTKERNKALKLSENRKLYFYLTPVPIMTCDNCGSMQLRADLVDAIECMDCGYHTYGKMGDKR